MKSKTVLLVIVLMLLGGAAILVLERKVRSWREKEDLEVCEKLIKQHRMSLRMYAVEKGSFPSTLADLYTSRHNPHCPVDPWGRGFIYAYPVTTGKASRDGYVFYSVGPNGLDENGEGDDQFW